jgi:hypothetical protein
MDFRVIVSAAGLGLAFSLAPGQAEVLAVDATFAINGMATIGDPPIVSGDTDDWASNGDFEVQSAPIVSHDAFDSDRGMLAVTAVPELPTWATTLLSLTGFGR